MTPDTLLDGNGHSGTQHRIPEEYDDAGVLQQVHAVAHPVHHRRDHLGDAGVNDELRAANARRVRCVEGRAIKRNAVPRGERDGVRLRVNGPLAARFAWITELRALLRWMKAVHHAVR